MGIRGTVRDGAILFGALAVGAGGAVAAEDMLTGKDIENRSLGKKELTKKAVRALSGQVGPQGPQGETGPAGSPAPAGAILTSEFRFLSSGSSGFVAPGGGSPELFIDGASPGQMSIAVPPGPANGWTIRGLAVSSYESKLATPRGELQIALHVNGVASDLSCTTPTTAPIGECTDTGAVAAAPGAKLTLAAANNSSTSVVGATITLSFEPAG